MLLAAAVQVLPIVSAALARHARVLSFTGELQQSCHTPEAVLALSQRRVASPTESTRLLSRLVSLTPRKEVLKVSKDRRLASLLKALDFERLKPTELAQLLWTCAMLQRPLRRPECPPSKLVGLLDGCASQLDAHVAAQAAWAWESLARDAGRARGPMPEQLLQRASELPFAIHLAVIDPELLDLDALLAETNPRAEAISSGSANPSKQLVVEQVRRVCVPHAPRAPRQSHARTEMRHD